MENNKEPINANENAAIMVFFSLNFSTKMPAGIDITPYAMKNANGNSEDKVKLRLKLLITSGFKAPRIFVMKEITKNVDNINITM